MDQDGLNAVLKDNLFKIGSKYNVTTFDVTNELFKKSILRNTVIVPFTTGNKQWIYLCENRFRSLYYFYLNLSPQKNIRKDLDSTKGLKRKLQHVKIILNDIYVEWEAIGKIFRGFLQNVVTSINKIIFCH